METVRAFLSTLMSAVSNSALYSREHASVAELSRKAIPLLEGLLAESESLELMVVGDDLIVNKIPLRNIGAHGANFLRRLKRKGISRVDFLKGITYPEVVQFVADMSAPSFQPRTYAHIRTGVVDVKVGGLKLDVDLDLDVDQLAAFTSEQVGMVREMYQGLTPFKKLNIAGLEEIIVNFIVTFKREANILKLISPVKSFSEYTYTHAANVAVLSMFQAEVLGIRGDLLRDIGIAGLLHDVGKLFVSKEVLEKQGALTDPEWSEVQMHPVFGAKYLSLSEGLPRLAAIVAFEHHRRFDGKGYPGRSIGDKQQHVASQIVAISDFFDALRSRRPYRESLHMRDVLMLMKRESGTAFNPVLLDHFIRSMLRALSE